MQSYAITQELMKEPKTNFNPIDYIVSGRTERLAECLKTFIDPLLEQGLTYSELCTAIAQVLIWDHPVEFTSEEVEIVEHLKAIAALLEGEE